VTAESTRVPTDWHLRTAEEVAKEFGTDQTGGLTSSEAAARLAESGPNILQPRKATPAWMMFLGQFNDFMIWVLFVAVAISALEGEVIDAIAITAILVLNGVLGFMQEYRAEKAMAALQEMASPTATVVRDGIEQHVAASQLVPGDIVLLASGDKVPADGRLIEAAALRVDESSLTGESRPASKVVEPLFDPEASLGDRANLVFAATAVSVGRGRIVVTGTGQTTEMGHIADLLADQEEELTPLQKELRVVGKRIAVIVLIIAGIVFVANAMQAGRVPGETFATHLTTALLIAISLAVAAIPEGLPAIVTVALSLGVRKMADRNAIVRRLHAVETLGSTTFICSDKTGTLTRNEMTVRRLVVGDTLVHVSPDWAVEPQAAAPDEADLELLLRVAASCNDAHFTSGGELIGDPTETALIVAADHLSRERVRPRRIGEVPFDSARKRMTTVHALGDHRRVAYMKGAPDVVLHLCSSARLQGEDIAFDEGLGGRLVAAAETLASSGYRTLAVAYRDLAAEDPDEGAELEHDLVFLGLIGMVDPPRAEVPAAIAECHRAGIQVAMVTGDHALTAQAIGAEIGLLDGKEVVTGAQLERMSDDELYERVEDIRIYARVDPEHKLRIVDALKRRGETVAMTGDGVNDAPALKRADVGVAMGRIGTDVSREAADMVLADDDFATIVAAVREGRAVFANLRKFILFLLSCNISEVLIVFTTTFFSPVPALRPLQLLWINLVTDGLPALALGVDPASADVMDRGPRKSDEGILTPRTQLRVAWQGALIALAGLSMYVYAHWLMPGHDGARAQTMLFTAMVLAQLVHAFNFRSDTRSVFSAESLKNPWLVLSLLGSMALQVLAIYVPALQRVFGTAALTPFDWLVLGAAALLPTIVIDAVKMTRVRRAAR
jgi:P-type Ca2+ transporter type 2C